MVPTKKVDTYELWYGKFPNLSYLKVCGCEELVKRDTPDKLQQRSVKYIFIGYPKTTMGYYFYFPPENKIVVARYAEFFEKSLITQEVSRRAIDLKEIQDEDTSPSEITSEIPMEVEGFEPPQEEVIPILTEDEYQAQTRYRFFRFEQSAVSGLEELQAKYYHNVCTKAEYIAASEAAMEAVLIRKFISGAWS
ncbi:hypothetical protein Tco_0646680 [Tanacetum coccineum]